MRDKSDEGGVGSRWRAEGVRRGTLRSAKATRLGLSCIVYDLRTSDYPQDEIVAVALGQQKYTGCV